MNNQKDIYRDRIEQYASDFYIKKLTEKHINPRFTHFIPHRHNYHQIIWVLRGKGIHVIDQKEHQIKDGSVYLISQNQVHYVREHTLSEGFIISFSDVFLEHPRFKYGLFYQLPVHTTILIPQKDRRLFNSECRALYESYHKRAFFGKQAILQSYLQIILTRLEHIKRTSYAFRDTTGERDYLLFERFLALSNQNFASERRLSFYTGNLGLSSRRLFDIVKRFSGFSPAQFLEKITLNEAGRRLRFSAYSIQEIAWQLGYSDDSYFVKVFKKHYHKTPLQFRKEFAGSF